MSQTIIRLANKKFAPDSLCCRAQNPVFTDIQLIRGFQRNPVPIKVLGAAHQTVIGFAALDIAQIHTGDFGDGILAFGQIHHFRRQCGIT